MNFSSFPAPVPGWQTGPPRALGFAMQYNTAVVFSQLNLLKIMSWFSSKKLLV